MGICCCGFAPAAKGLELAGADCILIGANYHAKLQAYPGCGKYPLWFILQMQWPQRSMKRDWKIALGTNIPCSLIFIKPPVCKRHWSDDTWCSGYCIYQPLHLWGVQQKYFAQLPHGREIPGRSCRQWSMRRSGGLDILAVARNSFTFIKRKTSRCRCLIPYVMRQQVLILRCADIHLFQCLSLISCNIRVPVFL